MKKLNQDSSFNIKNTGVFFKCFNDSWERICFLGKIITVVTHLPIFKSETTFEKKLLKIVHIFLSSEICFSAALRINFSPCDIFFYEKKNNSLPEGSIICDFFVLRLSKYNFLVFLKSFLQKFSWILSFSLFVWLLFCKNLLLYLNLFIIALWSSLLVKGALFAQRYFFW